ncbi:MAG: hypothetical protein JJU05_04215 [Verrucomicrobia bacterium]|nr:hypothetical protein [Verrucomicrobiota bacterium]MCH8525536.1 hypothetical protein [Kiritimatiellia bacterium]
MEETVRLEGVPSPEERHPDPGISERAATLARAPADHPDWKKIELPGMFKGEPVDWERYDGEVVLHRVFDLREELLGQDLLLSLGAIDDYDTTWINGEVAGSKSDANAWRTPRFYRVPAGLLNARGNEIVIRVWDAFGGGGFSGIAGDLWIGPEDSAVELTVPDTPVRREPPFPSLLEWQRSVYSDLKP